MKEFFAVAFLGLILMAGCTEPTGAGTGGNGQAVPQDSPEAAQQWSEKVRALGEPQYDTVNATGYKILPFPGLGYNGIRDGFQAFYAINQDYTFAIYADQEITASGKSFDAIKADKQAEYSAYGNTSCDEISTSGWITNARAFACTYHSDAINAEYKTVTLYRDGSHVSTILGVWGKELLEYEYIYDEFNAKAVSWT